jgi:hypothetical protein
LLLLHHTRPQPSQRLLNLATYWWPRASGQSCRIFMAIFCLY